MAKRPRMGRNLNALLGSSARERSAAPSDRAEASPKIASAARPSAASDTAVANDPVKTADEADRPADTVPAQSAAANEPSKPSEPGNVTHLASVSAGIQTDPVSSLNSSTPSDNAHLAESAEDSQADTTDGFNDRLRMIGVDQIRRGTYQPRRLFDQALLQELADSIKAQGMIQPIIVRPFAGAFELVAGERRWRAAQLAGITELPAIVREMEDQSVAAVSIIENIQRKDLNPLEEAAAFERLCDEFGMTHKAVAEAVGRSRVSVTNLLRLLELHDEVKLLVDRGELDMGHARAILGAPKERQFDIAKRAIKEGMTVRSVEKLVREINQTGSGEPEKAPQAIDPDIERLSQKLGETLGAAVRIQHRDNGAGKLEIRYSSVSELQGILAHIK